MRLVVYDRLRWKPQAEIKFFEAEIMSTLVFNEASKSQSQKYAAINFGLHLFAALRPRRHVVFLDKPLKVGVMINGRNMYSAISGTFLRSISRIERHFSDGFSNLRCKMVC